MTWVWNNISKCIISTQETFCRVNIIKLRGAEFDILDNITTSENIAFFSYHDVWPEPKQLRYNS